MSNKFSELKFEEWIEKSLLKNGYDKSFIHSNKFTDLYDRDYCLIEEDVIEFIKSTQKEEYDKLFFSKGELTDSHILKKINELINKRGIIHTLRKGFETQNCKFDLVYFQPKSNLNPTHQKLYSQNIFTIVRQLHFSKRNNQSIDMVLFLNGIPIVTMELKNQLSGQNISNSEYQYRNRDEKEPIFSFKRVLVHFCVDNDRISMTTQIKGLKTKFLPYNKDFLNPLVEGDYRTEYLWNEILIPDSILEIIENFVLISKESEKEWDERKGMVVEKSFEVLIFPRYHQLEVIRKLKHKIKEEGVGNNYLIQHTTGSGKSYSIGWLSHLLVSLYQNEGDTKRMFDSILIITDRKVLDQQLQNIVSKLEQTDGIVNPVDLNSQQLRDFLEKGKDIIITTIQKFGVISDTISKLKNKTFGVIIDEVHSSQSGESQKHLKKSLSKGIINQNEDEQEEDEKDLEELIMEEILSRGKQKHISFFGFTGTPKPKTLQIFGRKNEVGKFVSFHSYSMKQSIHENFTLDVLKSYTTYNRYFKVVHSGTDIEIPEGKGKKELIKYVDSHSITIENKVGIILDHFVKKTSKSINGRGRGMVVVRSRKHCVLFHEEMVKQMRERGLPYSCLVGFSGTIFHNGKENTESSLNSENGMVGSSIPDGFKDPRFRILIVSNKFQTGFDEPLLQSMYIDKKLGGVQCVQTLSRLNRTSSGKTETFILDFVNQTEDIVKSFEPFFTTTEMEGETDPDMIYGMILDIEDYKLYTLKQVDDICKIFFSKDETNRDEQYILGGVVNNFNDKLNDEQKEDFKSKVQSFLRQYSYISQISNFGVVHWEKSYIFLSLLNRLLPKREGERIFISDLVDLDSLRIKFQGEHSLGLGSEVGELPQPLFGGGKVKGEEEKELLSQLVEKVNSIFGSELKEDDKVTVKLMEEQLRSNNELKKVLNGNNTEEVKYDYFQRKVNDMIVDIYSEKFELYTKLINEKVFPYFVSSLWSSINQRNQTLK
jgi:type I restriction enzyme, R subunit